MLYLSMCVNYWAGGSDRRVILKTMNLLPEWGYSYLYKETDTQIVQLCKFILAIYLLQHLALFLRDHLNFTAANIVFRLNFQKCIDNIFS